MTAAIISLAVALAAAIVLAAYLAHRLQQVTPELIASGKAVIAEAERAQTYREERDMALVQVAESRAAESAALVRLKLAEKQRNEAAEEERKHVVERIKAARIGDAARIVDDLLSSPLSGATASGDATAAGDRPAAAGVQPSGAAPADRAGRRP